MVITLTASQGPLARLWAHYEHQLQRRPLATNVATSAVLWATGDVLAQRCEGNKGNSMDYRRTALTAVFGGSVIGPCGYVWYERMLDVLVSFFGKAGTLKSLLAKVLLDNTLYSSFYMLAFFAFGELVVDQGTWGGLVKQLKEEFLPTYCAEVLAWPPIMMAIFTKLPPSHHLLAVNLLCVLDVAFLAVVRSGAASLNDFGKAPNAADTAKAKHEAKKLAAKEQKLAKEAKAKQAKEQAKQAKEQERSGRGTGGDEWFMVPALASMNSNVRARGRKQQQAGEGAAAQAAPFMDVPAHAAAVCAQVQQVVQCWVPASFRA